VEGKRLVAEGSFAAGCVKLAQSERLDPAAGTLMNLADCYEKNGQLASAWTTFREAATFAQRGGRQRWADQAISRAALLEPRLSTLTLEVDPIAAPQGLEIACNGLPVASSTWGLSVPYDPSEVEVEARAPGKKPFRTVVAIDAEHPHAVVSVPPLEDLPVVASAREAPPKSSTWGAQRVAAVSALGVGVVGFGVSGALIFAAKRKQDQADSDPKGQQTADSLGAVREGNAATAFVIGGAAFALAGVLLWVTVPKAPARVVVRGSTLSIEGQF
jgi:hypothetical protein